MEDLLPYLSHLTGAEVGLLLTIWGLLQYVYSCMVQSLPEPYPEERWYGFWYGFLHTMAGNVGLTRAKLEKKRAQARATFRDAAVDGGDPQ